jgi:PIN domain nuclease of toxin-antitoxin system
MRLLLDTHAFVWWQTNDPQLSTSARTAIAARSNDIFVSAVTIWELAMKRAKGQILISGSFSDAITENHFIALAIDGEATEQACELPWHHRDPWDRLLIAQAFQHGLTLVSRDTVFSSYAIALLWD